MGASVIATVIPAPPPRVNWACPKCEAEPEIHGDGGIETCQARKPYRECGGFLCECDDLGIDKDHGETFASPCENAVCHHCGWFGQFPVVPRKAQAWEKKALAAGWTPPEGWSGLAGRPTRPRAEEGVA